MPQQGLCALHFGHANPARTDGVYFLHIAEWVFQIRQGAPPQHGSFAGHSTSTPFTFTLTVLIVQSPFTLILHDCAELAFFHAGAALYALFGIDSMRLLDFSRYGTDRHTRAQAVQPMHLSAMMLYRSRFLQTPAGHLCQLHVLCIRPGNAAAWTGRGSAPSGRGRRASYLLYGCRAAR